MSELTQDSARRIVERLGSAPAVDTFAAIRKALAAGPTPGPWESTCRDVGYRSTMSGCYCTGACRQTGRCPNQGGKYSIANPDGLPIIPPRVVPPRGPADGAVAICGACGLRITRVMGYSCPRADCPCFPQVTCTTGEQA